MTSQSPDADPQRDGARKPRLTRVLLLAVLVLLAAALSGMLTVARDAGIAAAEREAREAVIAAAREASATTRAHLERIAEVVDVAARLRSVGIIDPADAEAFERFLTAQVAARKSMSALYWGSSLGEFSFALRERSADGPPFLTKTIRWTGYDRAVQVGRRGADLALVDARADAKDDFQPIMRPWFQRALVTADPVWTDPYVFFTLREMGISVARQVPCADPAAVCALGADVALDELVRLTEELGARTGGTVFIVTREGRMLAGPGIARLLDAGMSELPLIGAAGSPAMAAAFAALGAAFPTHGDDLRLIRIAAGGESILAAFAPIESQGRGWMIGMTMPAFSLARWLATYRAALLPLAVVLAALLILGAVALWRTVRRDLHGLEMRMASEGTPPPAALPPPRFAEFARLAARLESMRGRILAQGERTREALHAARLANDAKSKFLAQISHELRTPLNAVIGFAELAKLKLAKRTGPGTSEVGASLDGIVVAARHLLGLIQQILDFTTRGRGAPALQEERMAIVELVREAATLVEPQAAARGIAIDIDALDARELIGDRTQLREALAELAINAIKFSPAGGRVRLAGRALDGAGGYALSVRDDGAGMTADEVTVALAPFGRVQRDPYVAGPPGIGLGLPLVQAITEQHGGVLKIDSAPARGTAATITLPARRVVRATR